MTSTEIRDIATIASFALAVVAFAVNSYLAYRSRQMDDIKRFHDTHRLLFSADGYILSNLAALEAGTLHRPHNDAKEEATFHAMMLEVERLAILDKNKAVPERTQTYMFGWYAARLLPLITQKELDNKFWELGVSYLRTLAERAREYEELPSEIREGVRG